MKKDIKDKNVMQCGAQEEVQEEQGKERLEEKQKDEDRERIRWLCKILFLLKFSF